MTLYDALSVDYDRFVNWPSRLSTELPFLIQQFQSAVQTGDPLSVLDAACGTGMHAIALAQKGYKTAGADFSLKMIERARQNSLKANLSVRFETAGFGELASTFGEGSFNAIICMGNSLPHLLTREDLLVALADFYETLTPGGIAIIQNRNFDAVLKSQDRWMEPQSYIDENREWLFMRFYDFEPGDLLTFNVMTLYRESPGAWQQHIDSTRLRALTQKKLNKACDDAGFDSVDYLGNTSGDAFDPATSGNLIAIARKA